MKAPEFRQLVREDFAGVAWIDKLIRPLNSFLSAVRGMLQNGLTFADNLNAQVKTLDVTGGAFPVSFKCSVKGKAAGAWILRCVSVSGRVESPVSVATSLAWDQDGDSLIVRGVAGLTDGTSYRITLAVIGG